MLSPPRRAADLEEQGATVWFSAIDCRLSTIDYGGEVNSPLHSNCTHTKKIRRPDPVLGEGRRSAKESC